MWMGYVDTTTQHYVLDFPMLAGVRYCRTFVETDLWYDPEQFEALCLVV